MDEQKKEEIRLHIARNRRKMVPKLMKVYNSMDGRCRQMCLADPMRPTTDYCKKCQEMMKKVMG